ncbi:MAG: hypothetical protein ACR2M9_01035 [Cyanophyceae cyanobacterium]
MSFHVILPSNSSGILYPQNTLANFRVRLPKPLILNESYEVALEEIIYPKIDFDFKPNEVFVDLFRFIVDEDGEEEEEKVRVDIALTSRMGVDVLIWYLNDVLSKYGWHVTYGSDGKFTFESSSFDGDQKPQWMMRFHPKLAFALGYCKEPTPVTIADTKVSSVRSSMLFFQHAQMFIYSDFIQYQSVGDSLVPLLRISVAERNGRDYTSEKYIRPYYVAVTKSYIEEIHIEVRTHTGELFPFPSGTPLICKLHFKPIKNESG